MAKGWLFGDMKMKNFIALVVVIAFVVYGTDAYGQYAQYDNTGLNIVRVDSGSAGGGFNQQVSGGWQGGGFVPQTRVIRGWGGGFPGTGLPVYVPAINLGPIGYDPSLNIIRNRGIIIPPIRFNGFGGGGGIIRVN